MFTGQSKYWRSLTENSIRRSRTTKGGMSLLKAVNLSGKKPAVEVNSLEGNGPEWFST